MQYKKSQNILLQKNLKTLKHPNKLKTGREHKKLTKILFHIAGSEIH